MGEEHSVAIPSKLIVSPPTLILHGAPFADVESGRAFDVQLAPCLNDKQHNSCVEFPVKDAGLSVVSSSVLWWISFL